MLRRLLPRSIYDVMAAIGCFVALATGTAYAANTVFSSDIVDGEVKSVDIGNGQVGSGDVGNNQLTTFDITALLGEDIIDGTLTGADVADNTIGVNDIGSQQVGADEVLNDSLLQSDIRAGAVTGDEVLDGSLGNGDFLTGSVDSRVITDNSVASADVQLSSLQGIDVAANTLTGADIDESSLSMPPTTTATFASTGSVSLNDDDTFTKVVGKQLPAGSYAVTATANINGVAVAGANFDRDVTCELRNGAGFIGGAVDRRRSHDGAGRPKISLSMNGGAQVPAGGGEVSLWCLYQGGGAFLGSSQMMIIRIDGFF